MANWTANEFVNALLVGSKVANTPINYFLDNTGAAGAWTQTEIDAFAAAAQVWSTVANVTLTRVLDAGQAHFVEQRSNAATLGAGTLADHHTPQDAYNSPTIVNVTLGGGNTLTGRYATDI